MIEMTCPCCGAAGRVPADKINTRLACRKCLKAFHVRADGHAVVGPPPPAPKEHEPGHAVRVVKEEDVDHWIESAGEWWRTRAIRVAVGVGVVLLLWGLYAFFRAAPLDRRARDLARAILADDKNWVMGFASASTESDFQTWYDQIRGRVDELKRSTAVDEIRPSVRVQQEDPNQGTGQVVVVLASAKSVRPIGGVSVDDMGGRDLFAVELPVSWTVDGWGRWIVDGTRTLESAKGLASY